MDTMTAFALGQANRYKPMMVFDWNKAAQLIKDAKPQVVSAGLAGDWEYTGGMIFENGEVDLDSYTFLASTWATPEIEIDGELQDCFIMQGDVPDEWGDDYSSIKWPQSALDILRS